MNPVHNMPPVEFTRLHPDVPQPMRAHPTDAGVDLTADCLMYDERFMDWESEFIPVGRNSVFGTGVRVAIPEGYVGLLFARSSLGVKRRLDVANGTGVIDADYRGEVQVCLRNTGRRTASIERGERIAQLVVVPVNLTPWVEVEQLNTTERGNGGFGSTGV